jgi:phenylalanyl-tRNA synthetase beta chain
LEKMGLEIEGHAALRNPMSKDQDRLRRDLLPGLVECAGTNFAKDVRSVALFEIGKVFRVEGGAFAEEERIAVVLSGDAGEHTWYREQRAFDFHDATGVLEDLLCALGIPPPFFSPAAGPLLEGRESAQVRVGEQRIGYVGRVAGRVASVAQVDSPVYGFEIALAESPAEKKELRFQALPRFPASYRDLAVVVKEEIPAAALIEKIRAASRLARRVSVMDLYRGKQVPDGCRSVAFSIEYRDPEKTLTDSEVAAAHEGIVRALAEQYGARLR